MFGKPVDRGFLLAAGSVFVLGFSQTLLASAEGLSPDSIERALKRGSSYLISLLKREVPDFSYPLGARSLYAFSLVSAGVKLTDPTVEKLFQDMVRLPFRRVYSVSLLSLAVEAKYKAIAMEFANRSGGRAFKVRPTKADYQLLKRTTGWLCATQCPVSGGWAYSRRRRDKWYDLSNTQFAVLGLEAGRRMGLTVPADVAKRYVAAASPLAVVEKKDLRVRITYQFDWSKPQRGVRTELFKGKPRGWRYSPTSSYPTFAMTAATVGNYFAAQKVLLQPKVKEKLKLRALEGLLWLYKNWDRLKRYHKRPGKSLTSNYYYTAWTLEKACDIGGVELIGERNWYTEEALYLVQSQNPDGSWGEKAIKPVATSFALLFLSRAQAPDPAISRAPCVFTGKGASNDRDRVYLRSINLTVSAKGFFRFLKVYANKKLLRIAEELISSYQPDYRGELVPCLKQLLESPRSELKYFARKWIRQISQLKTINEKQLTQWTKLWETLNKCEAQRDSALLQSCLSDSLSNKVLGEKALRLIEAFQWKNLTSKLVEAFSSADPALKERIHRTLCFLTGVNTEYREKTSEIFWRRMVLKKQKR